MLHDLKKKLLKKKLEKTIVKTEQKKELLDLERQIKDAGDLELSDGEKKVIQDKKDSHNERADKLRGGIGKVFKTLGNIASNAHNNIFEDEKKKKRK